MPKPDRLTLYPDERRAEARFEVLESADFLEDHFPGAPMLPGLVMLDLSVQASGALALALGLPAGDVRTLDRLHVLRRVAPGETLEIRVAVAPRADATRVDATCFVGDEAAMRTRYELAAAPDERRTTNIRRTR